MLINNHSAFRSKGEKGKSAQNMRNILATLARR
jgi:hypothetical protein